MIARIDVYKSHSSRDDYPEDIILNQGIDFTKPIQLKTWVCKVCSLDNQGVICENCKKMYNHVDPDCFLKD